MAYPGTSAPTGSPEFIAREIRQRLLQDNIRTVFSKPGSPWENGPNESFNSRLRDELPEREIFYTLERCR